jgi:hypothetical protein
VTKQGSSEQGDGSTQHHPGPSLCIFFSLPTPREESFVNATIFARAGKPGSFSSVPVRSLRPMKQEHLGQKATMAACQAVPYSSFLPLNRSLKHDFF